MELARDVRARARDHGRDPARILFVPALGITIADDDHDAQRIERERLGLGDVRTQLGMLSRQFGGHDFSPYDLDAPFPDISPEGEAAGISRFHDEIAAARRTGSTLRQVLAVQRSSWFRLAGSPETIADELGRWYESGAADGFNLFVQHPSDWARFRAEVVPLLVRRGLFREEYDATTLRGNLGFAIPKNLHEPRPIAAGQVAELQYAE